MKELATLLSQNSAALDQVGQVRRRKTRHLVFTSADPDQPINLPLCGELSNNTVSKRNLHGVDCVDCLSRAIALAGMDSYADALNYISNQVPAVMEPDPEKMEERFGNQPTRKAVEHLQADAFLKAKRLKRASDLPKNIIGASKELYYFNMLEHKLIDESGEPIQSTLDELQSRIDETSP